MHPQTKPNTPRLIAWEMTKECKLSCQHCRIDPSGTFLPEQLSTEESKRVLDSIAKHFKPIIILTGGDPLLRKDFLEMVAYGHALGMTMVVASCGFGIDDSMAEKMKTAGIAAVSFSIDGADEASHDDFRNTQGSYAKIMEAAAILKRHDLPFQINMTVTKKNVHSINKVFGIAKAIGATQFHPFLFVPTGKGKDIAEFSLNAGEYEEALKNIYALSLKDQSIRFNPTCAPQYNRIILQYDENYDRKSLRSGCMGGKSFAFISASGEVKACGFLDVVGGKLRDYNLDFFAVWESCELFTNLRDFGTYHGKCGICKYRMVCGGCRARALEDQQDYLGEEPFCAYDPQQPTIPRHLEIKLLQILQSEFPLVAEPYAEIARRLETSETEVLRMVSDLKQRKVIRRIGPVLDAKSLGYVSALFAMKIAPEKEESSAAFISTFPGVTHNYKRDSEYNLWFTLVAKDTLDLQDTVEKIKSNVNPDALYQLKANKMYKIRGVFDV